MVHDNKNNEDYTKEYRALLTILEGTARHLGEDFFRALVKNLAKSLNTKGAWVTEYLPDQRRLRSLAFWMEDHFIEGYEYETQGTPCEEVVRGDQLFHVPDNIIELFPDDPDLEPFDAVSYLGAPLLDLDGSVLGHLAVQDTGPMPEEPRSVALFKIFADRAASELRRLRAEKELREREEQLSRLFESAMDAVIEIDPQLIITQLNPAAAELFAEGDRDNMNGQSFEKYLVPESARKLENLLKGLRKRPEGERFLWVPGGFMAANRSGETFQSEATLSCYEHNRNTYFNLILRNVTERIEAEKRIDLLSAEREYLREEISQLHNFDEIIGKSKEIQGVLKAVSKVAGTDASVLITGETGTGKELVARAIHDRSKRRNKPLVKVNCAAIPESLIESEFFGHEKGAFTGATEQRIGRFALANGGTMFLDEVGELPPGLQPKLLRILQEGEFEPVGSSNTQKVDVRVIAATNRNLKKMTNEGTFREDLYYRLNVFPIHIPPLRERGDDILLLADFFIKKYSHHTERPLLPQSRSDTYRLKSYDWPGNIRELQNIIERAVITSSDGRLSLTSLLPESSDLETTDSPLRTPQQVMNGEELRELERRNMIRALEKSGWKVSGDDGAARLLGIPPTTFSSRMKTLNIHRLD